MVTNGKKQQSPFVKGVLGSPNESERQKALRARYLPLPKASKETCPRTSLTKRHMIITDDLNEKIIEPPELRVLPNQCKKHSKPVEHIEMALHLAEKMQKLCNEPLGKAPNALALAHCQVDHDNPLRFFVMKDGEVIINPKILIGIDPIHRLEGCYSYPYRDLKKVKRYNKIAVEYTNAKGKRKKIDAEGELAHIFQHEIDHFNGKSIYCK